MSGRILKLIVIFLFLLYPFANLHAQIQDSIQVTARVPTDATDYEVSIVKITPADSFHQYEEIEYEITYGSNLTFAHELTVGAEWSLGTIDGSGSPTVEVLEYVTGSAGEGYGSTPAVIDPTNRRISWSISAFPGSTTNQTVSFTLKTTNDYTGALPVTFTVNGFIEDTDTEKNTSNINHTYLFSELYEPTPTFTPSPSPTPSTAPTSSASATTTPTPTSTVGITTPLTFTSITIQSLSSDSAVIQVQMSGETQLDISYGTSYQPFSKKISSTSQSTVHTFILPDLLVNEQYFFQINSRSNAPTVTSDIFTFRTARISSESAVNKSSLIISSNNLILFNGTDTNNANSPIFTIPINTVYSIRFSLNSKNPISTVAVHLDSAQVLGISADNISEPNTKKAYASLDDQGYYHVSLMSPDSPGEYVLSMRIVTESGEIIYQKVLDLSVHEYITILDERKFPIEAAQVTLSQFDKKSRLYMLLDSQLYRSNIPLYTNSKGQIIITLLPGTYKASIVALGYKKHEIEFTIGVGSAETYSQIILKKEAFSLYTSFVYYGTILKDLLNKIVLFSHSLADSNRYFELNSLIVLFIFSLLSIISLRSRVRVPLHHLFSAFTHSSQLTVQNKIQIPFSILDKEKKSAIQNAHVFLIDHATARVLMHKITNNKGLVLFDVQKDKKYSIEIALEGYDVYREKIEINSTLHSIEINTKPSGIKLANRLTISIQNLLASLLDSIIILSFIAELSLGFIIGWQIVIPFIVLSFINVAIWFAFDSKRY